MLFDTWTFQGARFLALEVGGCFHVVDATGNNYGAWQTVDAFRKRQRDGSALADALHGVRVDKFGVYTHELRNGF